MWLNKALEKTFTEIEGYCGYIINYEIRMYKPVFLKKGLIKYYVLVRSKHGIMYKFKQANYRKKELLACI